MKKILSVFLGVTVILALSVLVSAAALNNGGFELPLGDPSVVGNARSNDGNTTLEIVSDANTGAGALKVTNRANEWGAVSFDVTAYILEKGSGEYYATAFVKGFNGTGRITLHTNYTNGINIYRQTGVLHPFTTDNWTKFGVEPDDATIPIPMKSELDWDPNLDTTDLNTAVLYFWIEGNNTADLYIDDINFYKSDEEPVDWVAAAVTPEVTVAPTVTETPAIVTPGDGMDSIIILSVGILLATATVLVVKKKRITQ